MQDFNLHKSIRKEQKARAIHLFIFMSNTNFLLTETVLTGRHFTQEYR